RLDEIETHPGATRDLFVARLAVARNSDDRCLSHSSWQCANKFRRLDSIQAGERNIHQYDVVTTALDCRDHRCAGLDKIRLVPELAQDRIHNDAAIRIVLGTKNRQWTAGRWASFCGFSGRTHVR